MYTLKINTVIMFTSQDSGVVVEVKNWLTWSESEETIRKYV